MTDLQRLSSLMASNPETPEQRKLKDKLVYELRIKLGIIKPETDILVTHSEIPLFST